MKLIISRQQLLEVLQSTGDQNDYVAEITGGTATDTLNNVKKAIQDDGIEDGTKIVASMETPATAADKNRNALTALPGTNPNNLSDELAKGTVIQITKGEESSQNKIPGANPAQMVAKRQLEEMRLREIRKNGIVTTKGKLLELYRNK